jgi:hypothetical protein
MSRSARRQKSEAQLRTLEDQFSADLVTALRECAAGKWGMFGRNDAVIERQPGPLREFLESDVAAHLIELGEEIEERRRQLGIVQPFSPFERYLQYRQMHSANAPGESKLAVEFLLELQKQAGDE